MEFLLVSAVAEASASVVVASSEMSTTGGSAILKKVVDFWLLKKSLHYPTARPRLIASKNTQKIGENTISSFI